MELHNVLRVDTSKSALAWIAKKAKPFDAKGSDYSKPVGEFKPFWKKPQVIAACILFYLGSLLMPGLAANSYGQETGDR